MDGGELLQRCRRLATEQAALQGPVKLASPLQEGEDVDSEDVEDADHWVAVYSELVEFKCDVLLEMDRQAREMGQQAAGIVPSSRHAFVLELQRFQLHLEYWRGRREELRKEFRRL